jgi:hypothetical protein
LEGTVKSICESLKPNGVFYLLFDTAYNESFPMHISAKKDIDKILRENGLIRIEEYVYVKSNNMRNLARHNLFRVEHILRLVMFGIKNPRKAIRFVFKKYKVS